MLVEILLVLVVIFLIYKQWQKRDIYNLSRQLNSGVTALPFVGHSYLFIGSNETRMKALQTLGRDAIKNNNGLTSFWLGSYLYTMIADPVAAEMVLKTSLEKDDLMNMLKHFLGNGSIFAPVSIWKPRRKVLVPTLGPKNMKHFLVTFVKQSQVLADQLYHAAGTGTISVWNYFTSYTMDVIAEVTLGYDTQAQKNSGHPFLRAFNEGLRHGSERILSPWLHSDLIYHMHPIYKKLEAYKEYLWGFVTKLIKSKRIEMEEKRISKDIDNDSSEIKPKAFLELLIESSGLENGYTDIEVLEEMMVLMIAGNDTSAVASSFVTLMLSRHPEVQTKLYEELREVFEDSDRSATSEDLLRLKYLDAVIRETLRLYSPVPMITRKILKEVVLPSGIKLVPGTGVMVNIWAMHRNPRYWGVDAEEFRPERFIDTPLGHPAAFMPFSFGPRNCVGYQFAMTSMKTALSTVLRRYKILPAEKLQGSCYPPLRMKFDLMMKDVDNFQVQLEYRNKPR